jgi:TP901 family phage tail tape measure protein
MTNSLEYLLKIKDEASATLKEFSGNIQTATSKAKELSKKGVALGNSMTKKVTLPIIVGGTALMAFNNKAEKMDTTIIKGTGATGEFLEEMKMMARVLATQVPMSFDDVGTAISSIETRLGLTGEELQSVSKDFLDFARITDSDVSTSIRGVTRMMQDWGIENKDTTNLLNDLAVISQETGISTDQLTNTAVNYGVQLRALGFSQKETIALLGKFEKEGVSVEKVTSGLSIALGRLAKEGVDDTGVAFQELVNGMKDIDSVGEATREAIDLLGMRAGPDFALAVQEGRFELGDYLSILEDTDGALQETAESSLTTGDKFKMLGNKIEVSLLPFAESLANNIEKLIPFFESVVIEVTKVVEWFSNLSPEIQTNIFRFIALFAILGPVIAFISKLIGVFVFLVPVVKAVIVIIGAMMSPIGLFIAIIVIVIATIWKFKDEIWETMTSVYNTIKETFTQAVETTKETWGNIKTEIETALSDTWTNLVNTFSDWKTDLFDWGKNIAQSFVDGFENAINGIKGSVVEAFNRAKDFIMGRSPPVAGPFKDIDKWGFNVGDAWVGGFKKSMATLPNAITPSQTINNNVSVNANVNSDVDVYSLGNLLGQQLEFAGR